MKTMGISFLLVLGLLVLIPSVEAKFEENVAHLYWDGVSMYIPVSREEVQKKIDEWHESNSNVCESPRLFLPNYRVFPNLKEDQHPLYIGVGYMTFEDFVNKTDPFNPLSYGIECSWSIPFLTSTPNGPPSYTLALGIFYERFLGDIPKPNIFYPYIAVDKLKLDDKEFYMKNGCDEMKISFQRQNPLCTPPQNIVKHEFDDFINKDFHFGTAEPQFDYCDRHQTNNNFCATAERIKCEVYQNAPNICEAWLPINKFQCETSVEVVRMTEGFRNLMLIGDGPINSIFSETYFGNGTVGLKYPCME